MLDAKMIRQNSEIVTEKLLTRGVPENVIARFLELDEKRRMLLVQTEDLKKLRNQVSEEISLLKRSKKNADEKIQQMKIVGEEIKMLDTQITETDEELKEILHTLPNLPADSVPIGKDEEDNIENRRWSSPRTFDFEPKPHWEVAENLDILDFERGAKVTGSRFLFYKGLGARLERALYNFMLDLHVYEHGYTEMIPPYMVNSQSMFGTGQFPKFKEDVFQLENSDYTLIPTAEVPLTNYYAQEILNMEQLPTYLTALSPSFRSEAGSAGRNL